MSDESIFPWFECRESSIVEEWNLTLFCFLKGLKECKDKITIYEVEELQGKNPSIFNLFLAWPTILIIIAFAVI